MATPADRLIAWPQYLLPQQLLTALARRLATTRAGWISRPLIQWFARRYRVDLEEAESSKLENYACFDDFFTRALKPGTRPMPADPGIPISPCDGFISQLGRIDEGRLLQAKGMGYSPAALLGSEALAEPFFNGRYITFYLAPGDYHRVHMPLGGKLLAETRVPGSLFGVSPATTRVIPRLFARNERMGVIFDTVYGPVAVVMVAALLVAGIETVWSGPEYCRAAAFRERVNHLAGGLELERGAELGRFHWGSTVIVLGTDVFPRWLRQLGPGDRVRMGQALASPGTD